MPIDTNAPGYGSSDWEPDVEELSSGLSGEEIAEGFGLDPSEYGEYFPSYDNWRSDFAGRDYEDTKAQLDNQLALDEATFGLKAQNLQLQEGYAGEDLTSGLEANIISAGDAYGEAMGQMIDNQANSLMGGATARTKRTMGRGQQEAVDTAAAGANTQFQRALDSLSMEGQELAVQQQFTQNQYDIDLQKADTARDYDVQADKQRYEDEIFATMGDLSATGALDTEGYTSNDWINDITSADDHWDSKDFNKYKNDLGFLEWFHENLGSHDTDMFASSETEVKNAYENYSAGDPAGHEDDTCVLSTAAFRQGLITSDELMSFVNWRLTTQHKEKLSGIKWLGYQIAWKPVARKMDKDIEFAKFIKRVILDKWLGIIQKGEKHRITKFFVEWVGVLGFVLNYRKAMKLKEKIYANPKRILVSYKKLIRRFDR